MKMTVRAVLTLTLPLLIFLTVLDTEAFSEKSTQNKITDNGIDDMDKLKESYKEYLSGNETLNTNSLVESMINDIHRTATNRLEIILPEGERENNEEEMLFENVPLGEDEDNLSNTYRYLYDMALATKTYKSEEKSGDNLYGDEDTIRSVIDGLDWVYKNFFHDQKNGYYGNWYDWEIGMPTNITKTLMLLEDEISQYKPYLIESYIESMDKYLRNGEDGDVDLTSRFHTGANLADITTNRIVQGALLKDEERINKAINDQLTVFETIDPNNIVNNNTDGFYPDGSFIQHHSVAYTGSYGKVLLDRVLQTMEILDDTKYDQKAELIPTVQKWIYEGFSPVIYEGYMMEIVKGRAISRTTTGYEDVYTILEGMVQFSNYLNDEERERLQSHLKYIATNVKGEISTGGFNSFENIIHFNEIMSNSDIKVENGLSQKNHNAFNMMDKNVHVRDSYAFSVSRSSDRISKYEYMSGDNLMPWFQGDGAYYLYLSGRDQTESFGVDYFTTVNPYKLPGTTVPVEERQTIPELYDGGLFYDNPEHPLNFTASSESQNEYVYFPVGTNKFSGSVKLDEYGVSGIQLGDEVGYKDKQRGILPDDFIVYKNAEANKSYFMFDDEIVLLGSGIHDPMNREIITTIDNRMFGEEEISEISGETATNEKIVEPDNGKYDLKWINFKTNNDGSQIGYYFPETSMVDVTKSKVTESLDRVRTSNPDTEVTKNYFTLGIDHGVNPSNGKYAYVILPDFNKSDTEKYAAKPNIDILSNTDKVHAVDNTKLGITGFNFFTDNKKTVGNITSFNEASIIMKEEDDGIVTLAISDPTFNLDKMKLEIQIPDPGVIEASEGIKTSVSKNKALIHVDSKDSNGKTFEIKLKANEVISANEIKVKAEQLADEGAIQEGKTIRAITTHLFSVSLYEDKEEDEKVVKHMKGFKTLIAYQKEKDLISEEAFETLDKDADLLIRKW